MSLHGRTIPPTIFVIASANTEQADICSLILQVRVVDLVQFGSRDVLVVYPSALTNAATYLTLANEAAAQDSLSAQYPIPFGCVGPRRVRLQEQNQGTPVDARDYIPGFFRRRHR